MLSLKNQELAPVINFLTALELSPKASRCRSKLVKKLPGRGGWELRLVVQGGLRILDKIEAQGFNTLQQRPKLGGWDVAVMGWRALWM